LKGQTKSYQEPDLTCRTPTLAARRAPEVGSCVYLVNYRRALAGTRACRLRLPALLGRAEAAFLTPLASLLPNSPHIRAASAAR